MSSVIATIKGEFQGNSWVARLTRNGWECDNPHVSAVLQAFDPDFIRSINPLDQRGWGVDAAVGAARMLKGELHLNPASTADRQGGETEAKSRGSQARHYGKVNPVLPPPRPVHVDNPVEVLLTARNPEQVRRHFARFRQARLYGWTQDTNYKGSKGGKWVGTDEDAGKVRYQANKPGSGRGGKKEPAGEKKGSGGGGKPSPKEAHADIVQHLRDVLSGEGEEADALFAKLQDRLQGMSPSERKEAAAKLEAVLGGKPTKEKAPAKRATKQPAEKKPAAGKQASEADTFEATKQAWSELTKEGNVNIPELYDAVAEQIPGLTLPEFHKMLLQWKKDDLITLQLNGHRDAFPRSNEGIEGQKGLYFFVQLRGDPKDLKLPAGRDKPAQPAKEAPAKTPAKRQPAAAKKKPQKGDVNEKGQVFDGRWWRRPEGEKPAPKARAKKAAAEKQPAAKPGKIADKPTPGKVSGATPEQLGKAIKEVADTLKKFPEYQDGLVDMGTFYAEIQERIPDLTLEQFHNLMWQLGKEYKVELHVLNETKTADEFAKRHAVQDGERMYNFVRVKKDADPTPSKPVNAEKKFKTRSEYEAELNQGAQIGVPPSAVPGSPVHEPPRLPQPPRS